MKELELTYQLAELPSTQHRAGLAGLVLMVQYLHRLPWFEERQNALVEFTHLDEFGATLKLNLAGLQALFDLTYSASTEERSTDKKIKKFERVEEVETTDDTGKTKLSKRYYYSVTVPHGAFLPNWDKSSDDPDNGLWIKLWRDMLWQIVRGVPTTRNPFHQRVHGSYSQDAQKVWNELKKPEKSTGQSGNYYLGAMASNPENVRTKDIVRYQFLLNFWSFVAQVYRPAIFDKDGHRHLVGYVLAIPDVANLIDFCHEFPNLLQERESFKSGYLPREAIIDLPEEGGLDLLRLLRDRITLKTSSQTLMDLIIGVELIHAEKVGNSGIKIRSLSQVEPIETQVDKYAQIKKAYWCPWFRKQRLLNLLQEKPWWYDFDDLLSRIPRKWLSDSYFSHDARELFRIEGEINVKANVRSNAQIVYQVCQHYISSSLDSKYGLKWHECKGNKKRENDYNERKYKVTNSIFVAVRSRTESQAFIDYFVSTLYPFVCKDEFVDFADALFNKSDQIRALTLLALSSHFPAKKKLQREKSEVA
ncbi:MAG: type I-MYXAN CRISPR-associated protein Cmx8 [Coleofasciculaceae cyanobacterium]